MVLHDLLSFHLNLRFCEGKSGKEAPSSHITEARAEKQVQTDSPASNRPTVDPNSGRQTTGTQTATNITTKDLQGGYISPIASIADLTLAEKSTG